MMRAKFTGSVLVATLVFSGATALRGCLKSRLSSKKAHSV